MGDNELRVKLERVKHGVQRRRAAESIVFFLLMTLASWMTISGLDYLFELSTPARFNLGVCLVFATIGCCWLRQGRFPYQARDAAAAVERSAPSYGQRVRTSLDYSSPEIKTAPADARLVQALQTHVEDSTRQDDFQQIVPVRWLATLLGSGAMLGIVWLLLLVGVPELRIGAARALLLPLRYTKLTVKETASRIAAGDDLEVEAELTGRSVQETRVEFRGDSSQPWKQATMMPAEEQENTLVRISGSIEECVADFEFRVVAGRQVSAVRRVEVLQPLVVERFESQLQPPKYTGQATKRTDKAELAVLQGTNLRLEIHLNRPANEASFQAIGSAAAKPDEESASHIELQDDRVIVEMDDIQTSQQFAIAARAVDGVSLDSPRWRLRVTPDGKPRIRFVRPPEDLEVTPSTEVALSIQASDDFGLRRVGIVCQVADGPLETIWEKEFEGSSTMELAGEPVLFLEDHDVTFQDAVTYYAFADEARSEGGRRSTTDLRFIDIRPYKREFQILEQGGT